MFAEWLTSHLLFMTDCGVMDLSRPEAGLTISVKILPMRDLRRVAAVAYQGLCTFEFGVVVEMFALPRPELQVPWYSFTVCSAEAGPLKAMGGVTVQASSGLGTNRDSRLEKPG
jgi:hypothetical protein